MNIVQSLHSRLLVITVALIAAAVFFFALSPSKGFLQSVSINNRVLLLCDADHDEVLSVSEMRLCISAMISAIARNNNPALDLDGSGRTERADLRLLISSIRAFLSAECGNSQSEAGEQCDDGNQGNTDTCTNSCKNALCGDTFTQGTEQCDDGNQTNIDSCTNACRLPSCGDGFLQGAEQCDDGNFVNNDQCANTCRLASCGDGIPQSPEQCDDANQSNADFCTNACRLSACGDSFKQGSEQCDDGNQVSTDECTTLCKNASCGDSFKQGTEECDDGNQINADSCLNTCIIPVCGNSLTEGTEQCDDGNSVNTDSCINTCKLSSCGDTFVQGAEQCDDANQVNTDLCTNVCLAARCGDGFKQGTEQCDDGNKIDNDSCTGLCKYAACGDGFKQGAEQCDDGNIINTDFCINTCKLSSCGDSFVQGAEQCDDANQNDIDTCKNNCRIPLCGDGIRQAAELCDDGNQSNNDFCTNACKPSVCGDGFLQGAEKCDDGNVVAADGCNNLCSVETGYICSGAPSVCVDHRGDIENVCSQTNAWKKLATTIPSIVSALGTFENKLFLVTNQQNGGINESIFRKYTHNASGGTWSSEAPFPVQYPMHGKAYAMSDSVYMIFDGSILGIDGQQVQTPLSIFRRHNGAWSSFSTIGLPSGSLLIKNFVEHQGSLYLLSYAKGKIFKFSSVSGWTQVGQTFPVYEQVVNIASINGHLYAGRWTSTIGTRHIYELRGSTWELTDLAGPQRLKDMVAFGDSLFLLSTTAEIYQVDPVQPNAIPSIHIMGVNAGANSDLIRLSNHLVFSNKADNSYYLFDSSTRSWNSIGPSEPQEILFDGLLAFKLTPAGGIYNEYRDVSCKTLTTVAGNCGNSIIEGREECDDGNFSNADSCTNVCKLPSCGDGIVGTTEQCDDGNRSNTDTCPNNCKIPVCRNGIVEGLEQCDDGNSINTDDCTNLCLAPACGDGAKQGTEQCDDGNLNDGDGCSSTCKTICGDGFPRGAEQCDDGNTSSLDGCSTECAIQADFICSGSPSVCRKLQTMCIRYTNTSLGDKSDQEREAVSMDYFISRCENTTHQFYKYERCYAVGNPNCHEKTYADSDCDFSKGMFWQYNIRDTRGYNSACVKRGAPSTDPTCTLLRQYAPIRNNSPDPLNDIQRVCLTTVGPACDDLIANGICKPNGKR